LSARQQLDLSILIVTYNSARFIGACLEAIEATVVDHSYEVIVVDNASSDGTVARVRAEHPRVRLLQMGHNAGFAAANNRGYAQSSGRNVLLLNGDAVVQPNALDVLTQFLDANPGVGVVAPRLENPDGSDQGTARSFPTPAAALFGRRSPLRRAFPENRFSRRYLSGLDRDGEGAFAVDWVSGACLMIRSDLAQRIGLLDERFFMYWEDADLCRRVARAAYGVWCVPAARVVHTEGSSSSGGWPPRQVRRFHRSAYRYYAKHHLAGPKRVLRPIAASALATRAVLIVARDRLRDRQAGRSPGHANPAPERAVKAGELA
jgi:GT2 family glycosyltransferase